MSPAGVFWSFSLRIYGAPGVEPACLDLQDRFGADVNLALYCLWIGRALTPQALARALEAAAPIHLAGVRSRFLDHFDEPELAELAAIWNRLLPGAGE